MTKEFTSYAVNAASNLPDRFVAEAADEIGDFVGERSSAMSNWPVA